ncbi:DUF2332 domain-containing protein [Novosphingobium lentum]|uniref:DUF2332 domain-containing protein n=1 Tax=Novosphingobium lentum TaxID=145287 RepID=UPI00082A135E|nr:DUF2332 domain-containing protein [Novosphingobium lentum]
MSDTYRYQTIYQAGTGAVADAFHNQLLYCRANDAPITARIVAALAACVAGDIPGAFLDRIRDWQGPPVADALALRAAGGLHSLHIAGGEPALDAIYRNASPSDEADAAAVADVIARRGADLLPWLDGPPQTNEAGRSSNFIAAMLWLADQGLPPRFQCIEIGSSAGINLMLGRYRYELGGVGVGPQPGAMRFAPEWRGPPAPDRAIAIASTRGCDVAPVDLSDPAQALRLKAYIWPEHSVRFERMEQAVAAARQQRPDMVAMNAADFVETELARPQAAGTTRVLMHSIVWQYVPHDQQARVTAAMEAAGANATVERPLAWISLEANRTVHHHELTARYWPGGAQRVQLGTAHAHGAWLNWFGEPVVKASGD